jgi:ribosomal protein L37E
MIEIEIKWTQCSQCRLIYMAFHRLHCQCPICGFPISNRLPVDCFEHLWLNRPEG